MTPEQLLDRFRFDVRRLDGVEFGVAADGDVWVGVDVVGAHPALWPLLESHALEHIAIEGTRKRLTEHRLKVCRSCGAPVLTKPTTKKCRMCDDGKLDEVRLTWRGTPPSEPSPVGVRATGRRPRGKGTLTRNQTTSRRPEGSP